MNSRLEYKKNHTCWNVEDCMFRRALRINQMHRYPKCWFLTGPVFMSGHKMLPENSRPKEERLEIYWSIACGLSQGYLKWSVIYRCKGSGNESNSAKNIFSSRMTSCVSSHRIHQRQMSGCKLLASGYKSNMIVVDCSKLTSCWSSECLLALRSMEGLSHKPPTLSLPECTDPWSRAQVFTAQQMRLVFAHQATALHEMRNQQRQWSQHFKPMPGRKTEICQLTYQMAVQLSARYEDNALHKLYRTTLQ